jgi:hypothetical protein
MRRFFVPIILSFVVNLCDVAFSQGSGAHGGDALRDVFFEAKIKAAQLVLNVDPITLISNDHRVNDFIVRNKSAYAKDIVDTSHDWTETILGTCAQTQLNPSPIQFSFPVCRAQDYDVDRAVKLLLHESVHHFGISDEELADKIADAIFRFRTDGSIGAWKPVDISPLCDEVYCVGYGYKTVATTKHILFYDLTSSEYPRIPNISFIYEPIEGQFRPVSWVDDRQIVNNNNRYSVAANESSVFFIGGIDRSGNWAVFKLDPVTADVTPVLVDKPKFGGSRQLTVANADHVFVWGGDEPKKSEGSVLSIASNSWTDLPQFEDPVKAEQFNNFYYTKAFSSNLGSEAETFTLVRHDIGNNVFEFAIFDQAREFVVIRQTSVLPTVFRWDDFVYGNPVHWGDGKLIYLAPKSAPYGGAIWDSSTDQWTFVPRPSFRKFDYGAASLVTDTGIFFWGGKDRIEEELVDSGGYYSFVHSRWFPTSLENAPSARIGAKPYLIEDRIFVLGGGRSPGGGIIWSGASIDIGLNP